MGSFGRISLIRYKCMGILSELPSSKSNIDMFFSVKAKLRSHALAGVLDGILQQPKFCGLTSTHQKQFPMFERPCWWVIACKKHSTCRHHGYHKRSCIHTMSWFDSTIHKPHDLQRIHPHPHPHVQWSATVGVHVWMSASSSSQLCTMWGRIQKLCRVHIL